MLPPFLGALVLVGTAGILVLAIAVALWAVATKKPLLARRALLAGGTVAAVYAGFWILGLALAPKQVLEPGKEVSFCGLDCHLHVSVTRVRTEPYLGVTVRFTSNAVRAPEWPGELKFRLRDTAGTEVAPTNAVPDSILRAGAQWDHELRFPSSTKADGAVLIVTWAGVLDLFVPGSGNPLVQRHRQLALPKAGV